MKLIKLDAIDSTNTFLKDLSLNSDIENYTVVVAKQQVKGKGQQGNLWISENFKNLTFSILINNLKLEIEDQKYLSFAISLAIFDVLKDKEIPKLAIKWPNDILSGNQKICGILIENAIANTKIKASVVGIGLNVNQEKFDTNLKKASSLKLITKKNYDLDTLLFDFVEKIKVNITILQSKNYVLLENSYLKNLYKKNIPAMFKDKNNQLFIGCITGISQNGNLLVKLENDTIKEYAMKEISFT